MPALLAPRRLLLLTDASLLVLREVTPLEQLQHVRSYSSSHLQLLHGDHFQTGLRQFHAGYGLVESLALLLAALAGADSQAAVSRIHAELAAVAALKTFRREDDAWGGASGDVALREETTHSVLFEAMVKWGSLAFLTQSLRTRAARAVDETRAGCGSCGSGAM